MAASRLFLAALAALSLSTASCSSDNSTLDLSGGNLTSVNASCFPSNTSHHTVNLSHCKVTKIDVGSFAALPNLTRVDLSFNNLPSLPTALLVNTIVTWLDLSGNQLMSVPALASLTLLTLNLSNNKIVKVSGTDTFTSMPHLQLLDLTSNPQLVVNATAFAQLPNLSTLRTCHEVTVKLAAHADCPALPPPSIWQHLIIVGVATLVSCVCVLVVVVAVYMAAQAWRKPTPPLPAEVIEFRALPPALVVAPPAADNGGYEQPTPMPARMREVERLPWAPARPAEYVEVLGDAPGVVAVVGEAAGEAFIEPRTRTWRMVREMSSRQLPPVPGDAGNGYEPVGVDVGEVGVEDRNSFSDFAEARARGETASTAPPIPPKPGWVIG